VGWRRVWRDVRLRRPAFDLVADASAPVWYRGRPFSLDRLPVGAELRARVEQWAESGDVAAGQALAADLADALRAPVAVAGTLQRPAEP